MFEKNKIFTKEEFQNYWGDGYYDVFNYGVGIQRVCEVALYPFFDKNKTATENNVTALKIGLMFYIL